MTKPAWLTLPRCFNSSVLVVAPAETAVRWEGSHGGTQKIRVSFQYWQTIVDKLPTELRPHGDPRQPYITVASEAEVKELVKQLHVQLERLYPGTTVKKRKSKEMVIFTTGDSRDDPRHYLEVGPESTSLLVAEAMTDESDSVRTWPVGSELALLWRPWGSRPRVRATDDELVFIQSNVEDDDQLAAELELATQRTPHGTWTFKKLLVGIWDWAAVTDLKGIESNKIAALLPHVNKPISGKKSNLGGAVVLPAHGSYRAESGRMEDGSMRWLRFVRE